MLIAARAMQGALVILRPLIAETGAKPVGRYVIGTVKGDIHDIGKNLCVIMLEGAGFEVFDLGVNTPPEKFVAAVEEHQPDVVGFSAFLTTTMPMFKANIEALTKAGLPDKVHVAVGDAGIPAIDEPALLVAAIKAVMEVSDAPICIDSSIIEALEAGLSAYEGKALVNSVTAEEDRMARILPLVKKHGAAVIGMANDETGISMVPAERLELARRIVERAVDQGIPRADVIIDPIAMTVGADPTCGLVTPETMRLIR